MDNEPKTQEEIQPSQVGMKISISKDDDALNEPLRCTKCGHTYLEHVENNCNGDGGNCKCIKFEGYP